MLGATVITVKALGRVARAPRGIRLVTTSTTRTKRRFSVQVALPLQRYMPLSKYASRRLSTLRQQHQQPQLRQRPPRRRKASLASDTAITAAAAQPVSRPKVSFFESLEIFLRKIRTIPVPRWITPRHYTTTLSEVLGHSSFFLVAVSYAVDDFMMLRCIAVAGSTAMLFFTYYHPHGRVLWLPYKWNVLFIAINSYRIGRILWQRHAAERISEEFMALRENHFYLMDPVDFYKLVRLGTLTEVKKGDLLVGQGENNRYVRMLLEGELKVLRDGKLNYILEKANFVSESGLHAGLLLPGSVESCCSVVADTPARVLVWDRTQLMELLEHDAGVRKSLQAAISWDVVRKLKGQRSLISSGLIDDPEEWTKRRTEQTQHRYSAILSTLLQYPSLLKERRRQLDKYRMIHHIDDNMHKAALASYGWTPEEFELGVRRGKDLDHHGEEHEEFRRDWQWYLHDLYWRIFG